MALWSNSSNSIPIEEIIRSLEAVEAAAPGAAGRNPRLGLRNAIKFLKAAEHSNLEAYVKALEAKKAAAPARRTAPAKPREETIKKHLDNLENAGTSNSLFDKAMNDLRNDNKVRLLELKSIVERYSNAKQSFRTKLKGYGVLEQVFDHRWKIAHR